MGHGGRAFQQFDYARGEQKSVTTDRGTRVFNVGGDYDQPKYVVLEV